MKQRKEFTVIITVIIAVFAFLLCGNVFAQQDESVDEVLTELELRMQKLISVTFKDVPIEDVIGIIAKQAEVDIIISPKVIGSVTATLTDIPLEEVLNNILAANAATYILDKNMIRVVSMEEVTQQLEVLVSKIYRITYANVIDLEKALQKFITARGSLSSMAGTSNIIVKDTESTIAAIDKFIEEVDRVTQQVRVEVRIYDVTDTDNFDLNINWNAGRNTLNSSDELMTETTGAGITYAESQPDTGEPAAGPPLQTSTKRANPFSAGSFDQANGGSLRLGFFNDAFSLDVLLSALQKQEWATLLANPTIMVLDNEIATFEIIKEIPYTENQQSSTGSSTMTSTKFKDVGVKLVVTPHITRDDLLRLHITPEFSVAEGQLRGTSGGSLVPAVNTRKLDTIALLKNGETIVLGGLRKQEVSKNLFKTPILGDLPLLGALFRSENETTETTELLVFITPQIIEIPVMTGSEAKTYEYTEIPKVDYPSLKANR